MRFVTSASVVILVSVFGVFACSSSGSSGSSCSCSVTYNGVSKNIDCGQQACVNGATFSCSSKAESSQTGTCTDSTSSSGSSSSSTSSSSGSSGCSLFTCTKTADCGGIAPCMSTKTGTSYCYEQEASADACSKGTTATTATVDGSQRTLCVPSSCPQPDTYVP